jgi:hypothetical protein
MNGFCTCATSRVDYSVYAKITFRRRSGTDVDGFIRDADVKGCAVGV